MQPTAEPRPNPAAEDEKQVNRLLGTPKVGSLPVAR